MKPQMWIFSVRICDDAFPHRMKRGSIVGPSRSSTIEAALHLADVPEHVRQAIREDVKVRAFAEGTLDPETNGFYITQPSDGPESTWWVVCIGSVHEVLS